jgi:hypothetical protein
MDAVTLFKEPSPVQDMKSLSLTIQTDDRRLQFMSVHTLSRSVHIRHVAILGKGSHNGTESILKSLQSLSSPRNISAPRIPEGLLICSQDRVVSQRNPVHTF